MPLIKLKHISSFSSEDTAQPSANLLKPETYRKWRCAEPGEKQAVVVLEMEKATKIHAIDIGNNGSALIEILVGRSSDSCDQYKVLLVTSSFMTPAESKTFTNTSRVRMFGPDKLSKPVSDEKWDKVKIVCTQPFNKNERYGLSFVSLHSPPEDLSNNDNSTESVHTPKRLGGFKLRDEEEESFKPGSLFFKKKKTRPPPLSTAAKVRDAAASSSPNTDRSSVAGSLFKNRQSVANRTNEERKRMPEKQELKPVKQDRPGRYESKPVKQDRQEKQDSRPVKQDRPDKWESKPVKQDRPDKWESKPVKPVRPVASNATEASSKRKHNTAVQEKAQKVDSPPKKIKRQLENVPFRQILKGVVFVLSGFKNPERGEIRDQALEMGAQYIPDWMAGCTHLICAFSNTPKYYQVKGKGKIVTKKWISDCHKKKRKLPTKNYRLPGDTSSSEDSSDEEPLTSRQPSSSKRYIDTSPEQTKSKVSKSEHAKDNEKSPAKPSHQPEIDPYDEDTDDELPIETEKKKSSPKEIDSEQDTEDELEKVERDEKEDDEDIYNVSTEDEDDNQDHDEQSGPEGLPELPNFFSKKYFLLYGEMDQSTRRTLIRYITAYDGIIEEYMTNSVDFVITTETWDENFEDALSENSSLAFIKPKWIFECHEKAAMVPFQPYIISPF